MKQQLMLMLITAMLVAACKQETKKESLLPETDGAKTLQSMQKKTKNEIVGLWKLYKVVDATGYSYNEDRNEYLNIKENNTFEERGSVGQWILSYGLVDSTESKMGTFLIKAFNPASTNPDTYTYLISKKEENGTTYFITFNLDDLKKKYYIRQQ
ncbi:MAG: hypothetical protein ABL872_14905 [Lacibacter sp.]